VLVIDNLITGRRDFIPDGAVFEHTDITTSEDYMRKLFLHYQVRYVFNYAAEPYVPFSFKRPLHVFNVNAMGAMKVMNAAWEAGCEGILQVSSAEIYGDGVHATGKMREDQDVVPHSSYGASKSAIDAIVQVRWREAQTPAIALRQFNCVGERETHPYVIPEIIDQLNKGPTVYLGNNSARDFQYAGDAVRMAANLLELGEFGQVYNMGSEGTIKIYDLAHLIGKLMGHEHITIVVDTSRIRPWEIWHLQSDNTKLYGTITERPRVSLEDALRHTIDYYRGNGCKWPWR
jgi:nucleoside-diphosphate-sugar epimerase